MQYIKIALLLILIMMLFANGCAGTASHSKVESALKVRLLWQGSQCVTKRPTPHAAWIGDPDLFKKTYAGLTQNHTGNQQDLLSRLDFSREGIVIVSMGQKPTGGYGLELNREIAAVSDDVAVLSIFWNEPPKGAVLPQVITSPCLAIILQKGPYSQIRVLDQNEHLRLQIYIK